MGSPRSTALRILSRRSRSRALIAAAKANAWFDVQNSSFSPDGRRILTSGADGKAGGSVADVSAKGAWRNGAWHLEFSRALNTSNSDDVVFKSGLKLLGQIAVFGPAHRAAAVPPAVATRSA